MPIDSTTIAAALGGKLAYDAMGPTAQYLGRQLKGWTKAGVKNIGHVLKEAAKRQADLGIECGAVAPRVVSLLLESAYYCEDELVAAYLGGVLASARSPTGRDDRAVGFLKLIEGLSTYALRAHCIVYASIARQSAVQLAAIRKSLIAGHGVTVVFDDVEFQAKMDFVGGENAEALLEHAFLTLSANNLCMQGIRPTILHKTQQTVRWVHLTPRGVELFCWCMGFGQTGSDQFYCSACLNDEARKMVTVPTDVRLGIVQFS